MEIQLNSCVIRTLNHKILSGVATLLVKVSTVQCSMCNIIYCVYSCVHTCMHVVVSRLNVDNFWGDR